MDSEPLHRHLTRGAAQRIEQVFLLSNSFQNGVNFIVRDNIICTRQRAYALVERDNQINKLADRIGFSINLLNVTGNLKKQRGAL